MFSRVFRAAKLEVALYEEVEHDTKATGQAALVVIGTSLAAGIGALTEGGWLGLIIGAVVGLISWAVWAYLNYLIGAKLFREPQTEANWGQLARTMGFASAPRFLMVLGLIPVPALRAVIFIVAAIWMWIAMVIAVRQALDYKSTWRAVGVTFLGWLANIAVLIVVQIVLIQPIQDLVA